MDQQTQTHEVDSSDYTDQEEVIDTLVRVSTVLAECLERRQPQWLQAELRQTLDSVLDLINVEEEYLH